ncbi:MAG: hypothetical protein HFJ48_01840 [Clostridia bacterium]|nr:hypothetical protein [Clostridia bacterium]
MGEIKVINKDFEDNRIKLIDTVFLQEENIILKKKIQTLTSKLQEYEKIIQDVEEME